LFMASFEDARPRGRGRYGGPWSRDGRRFNGAGDAARKQPARRRLDAGSCCRSGCCASHRGFVSGGRPASPLPAARKSGLGARCCLAGANACRRCASESRKPKFRRPGSRACDEYEYGRTLPSGPSGDNSRARRSSTNSFFVGLPKRLRTATDARRARPFPRRTEAEPRAAWHALVIARLWSSRRRAP
jgi:hypothetical protein